MSDVLREGWRTARVTHTCGYCGRQIMKGTRYYGVITADGGMLWDSKFHAWCEGEMQWFMAIQRFDEAWPLEWAKEAMWEEICDQGYDPRAVPQ